MKKIEAIVRTDKVETIREALEDADYPGMTLTEVRGHGKQKGVKRMWRGREYRVDLLPKTKIEIVVTDTDVRKIMEAISQKARTGEVGDGKIFVSAIENAMRVRTGEEGEAVI
ncbi:MAG: P-II family nitrogen regulator [Chloroflexota bacterium]|nr:P-II family nitrogen regulator [Chloroflexota bacterium]